MVITTYEVTQSMERSRNLVMLLKLDISRLMKR